jgi:NitT/TauT family transport system substrate-binding protein
VAKDVPEKPELHVAAASVGITYLPMLVAKQRGYFKDEGLDVTIAAFSGGSKTLEALLGGSSDMVAGAYSNTITMATKGQHLVVVAAQVICPGWIFGVSQKRQAEVKSAKDLKGMRIGVSAPGSSTHMALNYILHKAGLQSSDVSIIGVGQAAGAVAAVRAGQIDALIVNDPSATILTKDGSLKPLENMRTADGNVKVFGSDYPESSLFATQEFIDKNPKTVQAVANAIVRAEKWIAKATPQEVADNVPPEYLGDNKALYAEAFTNSRRCIAQNGQITPKGAQTVHEVLAAFDPAVASAKIDLASTYDNRFVKKAAEEVQP